ncbi:replication initiator protein [Microviridae sp.]|nr:replication initiator protein [Microviridae sp.]
MACHHPIPAYLDTQGNVVFTSRRESLGRFGLMQLRCGICRGCKADHARDWAIRCYHEAQLHESSCFINPTYRDTHLPPHGSLSPRDLQLFFKRLRKAVAPVKIRYFACGEYGTKKGRPHYHVCLFGWRPAEKIIVGKSEKGHYQYSDSTLEKAWGLGHITWTEFDSGCARYTAHYTADKLKSFKKDEIDEKTGLRPYEILDETTGEIQALCPEFQRESRRPGLGMPWLERFWQEVFPADSVVMDGREYPPPRAYFHWLKENQPEMYAIVSDKRRQALKDIPYETGVRVMQRNIARSAKLAQLERPTHGEKA